MSKEAEAQREKAIAESKCDHCERVDPYVNKTLAAYLCKTLVYAAKEAKTMKVALVRTDEEKKAKVPAKTIEVKNAFLTEMVKKYGAHSNYATMSVLKVWGFLRQDKAWHHSGIYQLTEKGIRFLRGHLRVPLEQVYWMDTLHIYWQSDRLVDFSEAMGNKMMDVKDHLDDWLGRFINDGDYDEEQGLLPF